MPNVLQVEDNSVYVVFSSTNYIMSKLIKFFTHNKYNHTSISLDEDIHKLYSFARYHINSPFVGGFIVEYPERYIYKNKRPLVKVCRVQLSADEYNAVRQRLDEMLENKEEYIYNFFSAAGSLMGKRVKIEKCYTCVEFVASMIGYEDISSIRQLEERLAGMEIYTGEFEAACTNEKGSEEFFVRDPLIDILCNMARQTKEIFSRKRKLS